MIKLTIDTEQCSDFLETDVTSIQKTHNRYLQKKTYRRKSNNCENIYKLYSKKNN